MLAAALAVVAAAGYYVGTPIHHWWERHEAALHQHRLARAVAVTSTLSLPAGFVPLDRAEQGPCGGTSGYQVVCWRSQLVPTQTVGRLARAVRSLGLTVQRNRCVRQRSIGGQARSGGGLSLCVVTSTVDGERLELSAVSRLVASSLPTHLPVPIPHDDVPPPPRFRGSVVIATVDDD